VGKKNKLKKKIEPEKTYKPKIWLYLLVLIIVSLFVYLNSLKSEFVHDDEFIIEQNQLIRNINNLPKIFVSNYWEGTKYAKESLLYRPIVITSYIIDYFIWKLNPFGYHLTNLIINTINCLLIYFFTIFVLCYFYNNSEKNHLIAFISSLLFAIHPAHTEAVTNIIGRNELLSSFFYISAFILYLKSKNNKPLLFVVSLFLYFLGLLSKEMAITLPALIIVFDLMRGDYKQNYKKYIGYFIIASVYFSIRFWVLGRFSGLDQTWQMTDKTLLIKLLTVLKIIGTYIRLLLLPINLKPNYEYEFAQTIFQSEIYIIIPFFTVLLYAFIKYRNKFILFSAAWFFIGISPVSNIIPAGVFIGERFLYLPSIGFCWLVGYLISNINSKTFKYLLLSSGIVIFSFLTVKRNSAWESDYTLWQEVLKDDPKSYMAYYNLGMIAKEEKKYDLAIKRLISAIKLHPNSLDAYYELGSIYLTQKLWDKAMGAFEKCLDLIKHYEAKGLNLTERKADILSCMAFSYYKKENKGEAIKYYYKAISITPENPNLYYDTGRVLNEVGESDISKRFLEKAISLKGDYLDAYICLANAYHIEHNFTAAIMLYEKALKLDGNNFLVNYNIALVNEQLGHIKQAIIYYHKAISTGHNDVELIEKIKKHVWELEKLLQVNLKKKNKEN